MFGLIVRLTARPGQRDALVHALLEGGGVMPGCLSHIVGTDPASADSIWITEVWDRRESHAAWLARADVQALVGRVRSLVASVDERVEMTPMGGHGLSVHRD